MLFWKKCWESVTFNKCCLVIPSILLTLKKWYFVKVLLCDSANAVDFKQANRANNSKSIEEFFRGVGENN